MDAAVNQIELGLFEVVKTMAIGRWSQIIPALTNLPATVLEKGSSDHPCPKCGGDSVIWPATDATTSGSICCRKCCPDNKPTGDGIATVAKWNGIGQFEAAKMIADYLGVRGPSTSVKRDLIELICREKKMPIDAFMQFGPTVVKRGRGKDDCVRVPLYDETGTIHSHFDFVPGKKGFNARGKGMSGMFFPGRLPQQGETWLIVEGGKDSPALVGLGYLAAGLPTSSMNEKYACLFAGVHVVIVPDLDTTGQDGAQKTGGRLFGIAESVRIARLPGEILASNGDDVRDVLSRSGGEQLVRAAIDAAELWKPREGEHNPNDGRPEVLCTLAYGWCCDQVAEHLGRLGWESPWIPVHKRESLKVYQRGGSLVQVVVTDEFEQLQGVDIPEGTARIRPLPNGQLPLRIADACQLVQEKESDGEIELVAVPPQRWLIEGVATRGDWGRSIRRLQGVITAPTIRPDGSILQQPGYDSKTGLLFQSNAKFPKIPEQPNKEDAAKAVEKLLSVVTDFPFVDDADRSAWIALVVTEIGRAAVPGCVPLFGITATTRGSGKSILADAASIIAYGRRAARKTFSGEDDETRKAITAIALEALPSVLLDNVDCVLGGASLDAAITATTWNDRILSTNKTTGELPLRSVWAATGNNLRFGSDLARRVLPIRLAPQQENPEERTDFEHRDLLGWVAENRPDLATAALTVLRAYVVAGRPEQPGGAWGSFEQWSELVRGAIVWAGLADPLKTRETAKADDQSSAIVRGLIGGLLEVDTTGYGMTAREIVDLLITTDEQDKFPTMREVANEVGVYKGKLNPKSLGLALRKYRGRVAADLKRVDWKIDGEPNRNGVIRWKAVEATAGYAGYAGYDSRQSHAGEQCVLHTRDTHTYRNGNGPEVSPAPPAYPALCPKCGSMLIPAQVVDGWQNFDCSECGHVEPRKVDHEAIET